MVIYLDENKIKNLVKIGGEMTNIHENNFRAKVIDILLSELGYDIGDYNEVQIEANVHVGTTTLRADYVIKTEKGSFVIEAKSPDNQITKKEIEQATGYASILKCQYSIVYNGNHMVIMKNSDINNDTPDYEWRYSPDDADISVFLAISKDNFPDMLEELIADRKKILKLKEYLANHSGELEKLVIKTVSSETKLESYFIDSHLKTLIEYNNESETIGEDNPTNENDKSVLIRSYRDFGPGTGLDFIKKHNAWGFINIRRIPDYLALYDADHHQINKLYKVKSVEDLNPNTYGEFPDHKKEDLEELSSEGKKFIKLGEEIDIKPIPRGNNYKFMGPKFTTYSKLTNARSGDDL